MSVDTAQPESATSADDAHEAFLANSKRAGRRNAIPDPEIDSATIAQISEDVLPELAKQLSLSGTASFKPFCVPLWSTSWDSAEGTGSSSSEFSMNSSVFDVRFHLISNKFDLTSY
ncbi:hypothetical protein RvY_15559-1 [Ramazzottius varieornatus]|uniref:Uncharacterized protein n=1 Tax=Ramazzottius varieornatus TaxID=947166 RepID=A0A1D1VVC1_RAMVA|nr:hypothetical protein RvY_15559-1 [Ramazzottius varieornatus]